MTERGLSVKDIAQQLGISRMAVYTWLKGRSLPDDRRYPQLARVLGVSVAELKATITRALAADARQRAEQSSRTFAAWLRAHMAQRAISGASLARTVGVDPRSAYTWTNGTAMPHSDRYASLAGALGISIEDLRRALRDDL